MSDWERFANEHVEMPVLVRTALLRSSWVILATGSPAAARQKDLASDERLTDLGLKESAAKILPADSVLVAMYCAKRFTVKDSECAPEAATSRE
jgi:hypothetical protein